MGLRFAGGYRLRQHVACDEYCHQQDESPQYAVEPTGLPAGEPRGEEAAVLAVEEPPPVAQGRTECEQSRDEEQTQHDKGRYEVGGVVHGGRRFGIGRPITGRC